MNAPARYAEIDFLRTLALVLMIIYHSVYDLAVFYDFPFDPLSGAWWLLARATASLFLLLVGISFAISWDRTMQRNHSQFQTSYTKYLKRGGQLFLVALLVTVITFFFDAESYVRFGILHMIAVSILLLPLFTPIKEMNIVIAVAAIIAGTFIRNITLTTSLLLPLGFMPASFESIDYFPLLPWFGFVLLGYSLGYTFYVRSIEWRKKFLILNSQFLIPNFTSRSSLIIYLVHQPLLLGILWLLLGKPH